MAPVVRRRGRRPFLLLTAALLLTLVPHAASGATPPLGPELVLSVSDGTLLPGESLEVSVVWTGTQGPYLPPEAIRASLYSVSEKKIVETYSLSHEANVQSDDRVRHYSGVIPPAELPRGELILTALDPISGTERRVAVSVEGSDTESSDLRNGAAVGNGSGGLETMQNLGRDLARLFRQASA